MEIVFDPTQITYQELLDIFWSAHDPTQKPWSRQYRAALFYHSKAQLDAALASRDDLALGEVHTEILPAGAFHQAEDYHQKYYLRQHPALLKSTPSDLVRSTTAARLNGYLGGHTKTLKTELDHLGLPPATRVELLRQVEQRGGPRCQ